MARTGTGLISTLLVGALLLVPGADGVVWSAPAPVHAVDQNESQGDSGQALLPRAFQHARLGMSLGELARLDPQVVKQQGRGPKSESLTQPSKDPYIERLDYRFHNGALYELRIHYRAHRIEENLDVLLSHLKDLYGRPSADRSMEFDPATLRTEHRTVWSDGRTRIVLLEREREPDSLDRGNDIVLTMTDLRLERMKEDAIRAHQRQKITRIPVPLPDATLSKQTASATRDGPDPEKRERVEATPPRGGTGPTSDRSA
ncbi:hypothetical protein [Candidatus Nitrospira bockiana]